MVSFIFWTINQASQLFPFIHSFFQKNPSKQKSTYPTPSTPSIHIMSSDFPNDNDFFSKMSASERSSYIHEMVDIPCIEGMPPKVFNDSFTTPNEWVYRGDKQNYYSEEQSNNPKSILFYFHGLNKHSQQAAYFAKEIAKTTKDMNVYALDFKGFGRSEGGQRALIRNYQDLVDQADQFIDYILDTKFKGDREKISLFLSGLSLGGGVIFRLGLKHPKKFKGIIMLAPAIRNIKEDQAFSKSMVKCLGVCFGSFTASEQIFFKANKYLGLSDLAMKDELNYTGKNIIGSVKNTLELMDANEADFSKFQAPYIVFQGGVDKFVDPFAPIDLEKSCKSEDKTTVMIKDMWHSVFGEVEIEKVTEMAKKWIQKRV